MTVEDLTKEFKNGKENMSYLFTPDKYNDYQHRLFVIMLSPIHESFPKKKRVLMLVAKSQP